MMELMLAILVLGAIILAFGGGMAVVRLIGAPPVAGTRPKAGLERDMSRHPDAVLPHFVERSPDAVLLVALSGRIVWANAAASVLFGVPVMGEAMGRFLPIDVDNLATLATLPRSPLIGRRGDGSDIILDLTITAQAAMGDMHPDDPAFFLLIREGGALRPMDARVDRTLDQTRRELHEKNRFLDIALNNIPHGLALYDPDRFILAFNRQFASLIALPESAIGRRIAQEDLERLTIPHGTFAVGDGIGLLLARTQPVAPGQGAAGPPQPAIIDRRLANGTVIRIACHALEEGGWVVTLADITAERDADLRLRTAKDQAEAANRAKSDFLSMISHEIRTPMNGVQSMLYLLQQSGVTAEQAPWLATARISAEALLIILDDILDFSKLEAGKLAIEVGPTAIDDVIDGVAALFAPKLAEKKLGFGVAHGSDIPPWIEMDGRRVRQILINLVGNAVKFTETGRIDLGVRLAGRRDDRVTIQISVVDTGPGIDAAIVPTLFTPFTQADSSISRRFGGTGLGLAISRQLAELMGGGLTLETERGTGCRFTVTIPGRILAAPLASPPPSVPGALITPLADDGVPHILIAEDNGINGTVLEALLSPRRVRITRVYDGAAALRAVETGLIDLVLMDIQMSPMDGIRAGAAIRALPAPKGAVPIIAVTANNDATARERALQAGMNDYLTKPIDYALLHRVLDRYLPPGAGDGTRMVLPLPAIPSPVCLQEASGHWPPLVDAVRVTHLASLIPRDRFSRLLETFLAEMAAHLDHLKKGPPGNLRIAHDMAGTCANYGFGRCEMVARQLMRVWEETPDDPAEAILADLEQCFTASRAQLIMLQCNKAETLDNTSHARTKA